MSAWEDVLLDSGDQRKPAEWWWAYVTDVDPLRIRRELETHPIGSTPSTLIAGLEIGDKVRVVNYLGQALIVGRAGGVQVVSGTGTLATGFTGSVTWEKEGNWVYITYDITGANTGDAVGATLNGISGLPFAPGSEYTYGSSGSNPCYLTGNLLRIPSQGAVTRRRGVVTCRV